MVGTLCYGEAGQGALVERDAWPRDLRFTSALLHESSRGETHVEENIMASKPYRSHHGNSALQLIFALGGRNKDVAAALGVRHWYVSGWVHGSRPVPRKHQPRIIAMLAHALDVQTQALPVLDEEQLARLRLKLLQALVEIDTERTAALMAIGHSLRNIRAVLGKVRQAAQPSSTHKAVIAKVDHGLGEALTALGTLAGRSPTSLEHHHELHAIVTSGAPLRVQVKTLLCSIGMAYSQKQAWQERVGCAGGVLQEPVLCPPAQHTLHAAADHIEQGRDPNRAGAPA
jgi:DNA-binding transcriptional regulator YdaS (Cro superfamily)